MAGNQQATPDKQDFGKNECKVFEEVCGYLTALVDHAAGLTRNPDELDMVKDFRSFLTGQNVDLASKEGQWGMSEFIWATQRVVDNTRHSRSRTKIDTVKHIAASMIGEGLRELESGNIGSDQTVEERESTSEKCSEAERYHSLTMIQQPSEVERCILFLKPPYEHRLAE